MAARGHLGGLALATPEAIRVLDAAGAAYVLVETVGVGQSEVEVMHAADTVVVVVTPRWGDGIQAGKAGLLEIGDIFAVNKADRDGSRDSVRELNQMIDLGEHRRWRPPVLETIRRPGGPPPAPPRAGDRRPGGGAGALPRGGRRGGRARGPR